MPGGQPVASWSGALRGAVGTPARYHVGMAGRSGRGVLLAVGAAWTLATGCAHGRGAAGPAGTANPDDPSPDAAKTCAGLDPFALGKPPDYAFARGKAFYCLGLYAIATDFFREAVGSTSVEWAIRDAS